MSRYRGPWRVEIGDGANPHNGSVVTVSGERLCLRATMNADDKAALHLIAAAPDLLEALQAAINDGAYRILSEEVREHIAIALVKARGE